MEPGPLQLTTPTWTTVSATAPRPSPDQAIASVHQRIADHDTAGALAIADRAVRLWPDHAELLLLAARLAKRVGRNLAAFSLLQTAEDLGSGEAATERRVLIGQSAPHWHFRMMNDEVRNRAYDLALRRYVTPDSIVLDIGCGAGLLSMMAARAGAKHVYACEVSEIMAHQARRIIAANGFADRITVINRLSNHLALPSDLPERADILVAEVFDTGLLGENALGTFDHARSHLLKPEGRILPLGATVQAALIESDLLHKEAITTHCCGFDMQTLNTLAPPYVQARLSAFPHRLLSEDVTVASYDFQRAVDGDGSQTVPIRAMHDGRCQGVAFWFTLDFGAGNTMSTGPANRWNCWMQAVAPFEEPIAVMAGDTVPVRLDQTSQRLLRFTPDGIVS